MDKSTRRLPPGPKGHFLLGNLPEFGKDLLGFITQCAREYGDIVRLRLANRVAYLLNHPDYMEYVLVTNHRNFVKNSFFWRHVKAVFGSGLLTSEGISGCASADYANRLSIASKSPVTERSCWTSPRRSWPPGMTGRCVTRTKT